MPISNKKYNPGKKRIKGIFLILFVFTAWAGLTIYNQWIDMKAIKGKLIELEKQEQQVTATKKELEKKVYLLQDDDYIAEMARKYYFLSKPGEIIIISPED